MSTSAPVSRASVGLRSERGPILLALMVATALVAMDATIVATTVHTIVGEIGGREQYPWLFSVYMLTAAVTTPVYAKLADTLGRKPVIIFGILLFMVASVLCGVAWNMPALIVGRALQGLGGGAIMPISITIMGDIYSLAERAVAQGYVASVWAVSSVLGPTLGGLFSEFGIWRGVFFVNIPLCLMAVIFLARNFHENFVRTRHRIDIAGALLLSSALTLILLGVLEGGVAWEWLSLPSIGSFVVGIALLIAFVLVERRAAEPVLPIWVFRRPIIATGFILNFALGGLLIGYTAFVPSYLEGSLGVSPLIAGLALATLTIGWPIASTVSGRFYLKIGFRSTILIGSGLVFATSLGIAALSPTPNAWAIAAVLFCTGLGLGLTAVPSLIAVQSSVGWEERGVATGTVMLSRSLGQAVGAGVLGAVATLVLTSLADDPTSPAAVTLSSSAVFVGSAVIALVMLIAAVVFPRGDATGSGLGDTRSTPVVDAIVDAD